MSCVIQGYESEVKQEQLARNLVYLDQFETVCGEPVYNVTPRLLATLNAIRTPFISGGTISRPIIAQFIWALHKDYSPRALWKRKCLRSRLARIPIDDCVKEIQAFIDLTFMDAPTGGKEEKPIASNIAWMVYRFRHAPWNMREEETANTPLRKLYQELRCWEREQGETPANRSDIKKAAFLVNINEWLKENPARNQVILDDWNKQVRDLANKEITPEQFTAWVDRMKTSIGSN